MWTSNEKEKVRDLSYLFVLQGLQKGKIWMIIEDSVPLQKIEKNGEQTNTGGYNSEQRPNGTKFCRVKWLRTRRKDCRQGW